MQGPIGIRLLIILFFPLEVCACTGVLPNTLSWLTLIRALNEGLLYRTLMCACKHTPMAGYNNGRKIGKTHWTLLNVKQTYIVVNRWDAHQQSHWGAVCCCISIFSTVMSGFIAVASWIASANALSWSIGSPSDWIVIFCSTRVSTTPSRSVLY